MSYLTTQHPVHENLLRVFFSNTMLESTDEEDEDPCKVVAVNTIVIDVPIQVTQGMMAQTFDMPDSDCSDEHEGFPMSMLIFNDNAPDLPFHERLLHLFISHFFWPIGSKHMIVHQIDYQFMYHIHVDNKINLPALIFQDLIKVVQGSIKTITYNMYLSYLIRRAGCNVLVVLSFQRSKYVSFDKHTLGRMQYIMDAQGNYVKNLRRAPKQPEAKGQPEGQHEPERHPALEEPAHDPPTQGPLALPLLALLDTSLLSWTS